MDDLERTLEKTKTSAIGVTPSPVFLVQSWRAQLELMEHLCHYSRHVLLILGPPRAGKTTFLGLLLQKETPHLLKYAISIEEGEDKESLLTKIEQVVGFKGSPPTLEKKEDLPRYVLLVDNAELASDEALLTLLKLSSGNHPSSGFQLLLFAKPVLEHRLIQPLFLPYVQGRVHSIEMEPFTFEETKSFLSRWQFQDTAMHGPLSIDKIQAIFDHSEGWPGRMLHRITPMRSRRQRQWSRAWQHWRERPLWWGLVLVFLLLGLLWMIIPSQAQHPRAQQISLSQMGKGLPGSTTQVQALESPEDDKPSLGYAPPPVLLPKVETPPIEPIVEPIIEPIVEPVVPTAEPVAAVPTKTLPKEPYTIQILGAGTELNIQRFVATYRLKEARTFTTTVRGKPWYVLIYGKFATKAEADAALRALPKEVQAMKPWVRRYDTK